MVSKNIIIKQSDGYETVLYPYLCHSEHPHASILILHGMAEHCERYRAFAEYLNGFGYDVYLYNHRGHGTDKMVGELGYFASTNGYEKVVNDAITITKYIKECNRSNHTVLFGHSMGSLILRNLLQQFDTVDCAIICGTTFPSQFLTRMGLFLSSIQKKIKGPKHISRFLNKLLFGSKDYKKLCNRTAFDWLSRSNPSVGAYISDPYCGYICTTSFYNDLLHLALNATKLNHIKQIRRNLPLLIISGDHDPVGGYGKQITHYFLLLQKLGFSNVDCTLYSDCRHELLNELNRNEISKDIVDWLEKQLNKL